MRVIAGKFRGTRLTAPKGMATRPTTDRTRESLFNILENRLDFEGLRVLDLFAGTGALGIEAISRGAAFCKFVDTSAGAITTIRSNIKALGIEAFSELEKRDSTRLGQCRNSQPYDLVFADPPYSMGLGERAANSVLTGEWIAHGGLFVLEENVKDIPESLNGFELIDVRKFGQTAIGIFIVNRQPL